MKTRSGFQTVYTTTTVTSDADAETSKAKPKPSAFKGKGRTLKVPRSPKSSSTKTSSGGVRKSSQTKKTRKPASPRKAAAAASVRKPRSKAAEAAAAPAEIDMKHAKRHTEYQPCPPDTAPVQNIYGEDVMPADVDQRLQQAIIFLSDEGPENHPRFKDKLKVLEHTIAVVWPGLKRHGDPDYQYDEELHRKCVGMLRVQRARCNGGYRRWFEETMFPQYPVDESVASAEYPLEPLHEEAVVEEEETAEPTFTLTGDHEAGVEEEATAEPTFTLTGDHEGRHGRGHGHGHGAKKQKSRYADGTYTMTDEDARAYARDPWAETLPRAEVWHRNMPNWFPFAETPFIEREMSKQISKDIGEGISSFSHSFSLPPYLTQNDKKSSTNTLTRRRLLRRLDAQIIRQNPRYLQRRPRNPNLLRQVGTAARQRRRRQGPRGDLQVSRAPVQCQEDRRQESQA